MKKHNKRTLSLVVLTFTYLLIGAAIFDSLESKNEAKDRRRFEELLEAFRAKHNVTKQEMKNISEIVVKFVPHEAGVQWRFAGSFYFSLTVLTTIGKGTRNTEKKGWNEGGIKET